MVPPDEWRSYLENDEWAAQLPQQLTQKRTDLFLCDVVIEEQVIQTQTVPLGAQRDSGNHRNFVAATLAMMLNGSRAPRRPSLDHQRSQQKARFIGKYYVGAQPRGVFFTRGQSFRFQRSMAFSSRSKARRSGFWCVHPSRCRSWPAVLKWHGIWKVSSITSATRFVVHSSVR